MKKIFYAIVVLVISATTILSCHSCTSTVTVPGVDNSLLLDTSLVEGRDINKARTDYMRARIVSVRRDCELKEEVTTITTTKDKIVIATLGKGTPEEEIFIVGKNPSKMLDGRGTGTIIRSYEDASYISTAEHVVVLDNEEREKDFHKIFDCNVYIQLDKDSTTSEGKMEADVIAKDKDMDLAILKIDKNLNIASELVGDPFPGEIVWSSGYAGDRADRKNVHLSITKGTLAALYVPHLSHKAHRVTSQIFSGNSGGPIWNEEGKLVGTVLFMFGHRNEDGSFTPYEGAYYIRPVTYLSSLAVKNQIFSEVFRE